MAAGDRCPDFTEGVVAVAAGPDDKFANSSRLVYVAPGVEGLKSPEIVVVASEYQIGAGLIEVSPEGTEVGVAAVSPRTPSRLVPICQGTSGGMSGQVVAQPGFLRTARSATSNLLAF